MVTAVDTNSTTNMMTIKIMNHGSLIKLYVCIDSPKPDDIDPLGWARGGVTK